MDVTGAWFVRLARKRARERGNERDCPFGSDALAVSTDTTLVILRWTWLNREQSPALVKSYLGEALGCHVSGSYHTYGAGTGKMSG